MCKLRRITHKFNIKPSGLYSICEWFAGVYTSIKTKKLNFIPSNQTVDTSRNTEKHFPKYLPRRSVGGFVMIIKACSENFQTRW